MPASGLPYIPVRIKFTICLVLATAWMVGSIWVSQPWFAELGRHIGTVLAVFIITFIAIVPGFMNAFLMAALALDRRPRVPPRDEHPGITVLVAAYNEAGSIEDTVRSILRQDYPGPLQVIVINDGSKDNTADIVRSLQPEDARLELIDLNPNGGKAAALNFGLAHTANEIVVMVDGDTIRLGQLIEGLDEAIIGLKAGESKDFTSTLVAGEYAGKEAVVTVTVQTVKEAVAETVDTVKETVSGTVESVKETFRHVRGFSCCNIESVGSQN